MSEPDPMGESGQIPTFVVVGNVNQGKSSIVRTLTENGDVPVDSYPGTTTRAGRYVFRSGGRELFTLVDTPGFQEPRHLLRWLQARAESPAERPAAVRAFVEEHRGGERFQDEVELLAPLVEGAGILYVVDASARFQPANEAEMEILRWTGRPGIALLNRALPSAAAPSGDDPATAGADRLEILREWRGVLTQYFNAVREFDAHGAGFSDRIGLLRAFSELRDDWRPAILEAVGSMEQEWLARRRRAAETIATLLEDGLTHCQRHTLRSGEDAEAAKLAIHREYRQAMVVREQDAWRAVEEIHGFEDLARSAGDLPSDLQESLFARRSQQIFGLTRTEMMKHGLWVGGASGAAIDAAVGGLSFGTGLVVGALAGGASGWFGTPIAAESWSRRIPRLPSLLTRQIPGRLGRSLNAPSGDVLELGPASAGLAWVLFERALVHALATRRRAHARTDELSVQRESEAVRALREDGVWFKEATRLLTRILESAKRSKDQESSTELRSFIESSLDRLESVQRP